MAPRKNIFQVLSWAYAAGARFDPAESKPLSPGAENVLRVLRANPKELGGRVAAIAVFAQARRGGPVEWRGSGLDPNPILQKKYLVQWHVLDLVRFRIAIDPRYRDFRITGQMPPMAPWKTVASLTRQIQAGS